MECDEHDETSSGPTPRADLLMQAIAATGRRGRSYGPPGEHFARTAEAAMALMPDLFAREMTPSDWAKLMMIDKLARDAERPILDTCIDLAGYAACLAEVRHWEWTRSVVDGRQQGGWRDEPQEPTWTISGTEGA